MPPQDPSAAILCLLISLTVSILFNLSKAAAIYVDDTELKNRCAEGDKRALRIEKIVSRHDRLKQAVNTASQLLVTFASLSAVYLIMPDPMLINSWWIAALVGFELLFYAVAVHSPRRVAAYIPNIAYPLSGCLTLLYTVTVPVSLAVITLSSLVVRLCGRDPRNPPSSVTEEEIRMLVDEGSENGTIEESEMKMINNIFEFDDRDVSQVLTHRTEVSAVDINSTLDEVAKVAIESGYSRLPVYDGDIDTVCGIIYAKDLLKYLHHPEDFRIADHIRTPICVPESSSCSDVFALLQREKTQIAIVVDEYGGTYGIVTMEDLIESIVGNIQDEYDDEEVTATKLDEGVYLLDGSTSISDAELLLDFYVPDDSEADTLGGFVIELLGEVPSDPEDQKTAVFGNITFSVVECDDRKIDKIQAVINPEE